MSEEEESASSTNACAKSEAASAHGAPKNAYNKARLHAPTASIISRSSFVNFDLDDTVAGILNCMLISVYQNEL